MPEPAEGAASAPGQPDDIYRLRTGNTTPPTPAPSPRQALAGESEGAGDGAPRKSTAERERLLFEQVMNSFVGDIPPIRSTLFYRVGVVLVACAVVLLPPLYVAVVGMLGYGVYWHATENTEITSYGHGRARILAVLAYLAPIVAGGIAVVFMLKPLLARAAADHRQLSVNPGGQPLLFAFVHRICDAVHAPRPSRIDVMYVPNAAASFSGGVWSMLRSDLVLTIGLPLAAGMTLQQFAGVLAHEFGHFSQGTAMRLSWIVRSVNQWFARVVYERDEWDEWLVETSHEVDFRVGWILFLARFVVFLSRMILWCFMMVSHALTCWLSREMEFDADRYEAQLSGSSTFSETFLRLHALNSAIASLLRHRPTELRSAANPIRTVAALSFELDNKDHATILRRIEKSHTGWFDTHPADSDRVARVVQLKAPGVFHSDLPAEAVFRKFDSLCASLLKL